MFALIIAFFLNSATAATAALEATVFVGATQAAVEQRRQHTEELAAWLSEQDQVRRAAIASRGRRPDPVRDVDAKASPFADDAKPNPFESAPLKLFWWTATTEERTKKW